MKRNRIEIRSYTYDGAGNTLTETRPGESFAYTYNKRNRLASVSRNTVLYGTYVYNALEQLTSRSSTAAGAPIGALHYIYDLDGHLIAEATGATGANLRDYIWLPANDNQNDTYTEDVLAANDNAAIDLPLAVAEAATLYNIHTDHLGRPIRMTDGTKTTVWAATWKPWGEIQSISGSTTNNLRFPGQTFQIETNLHYNWHRNYDPVTGRYTQPDPLGFVDGPSVYAYARSSPYIVTDRDGRCPMCVAAAPYVVVGLEVTGEAIVAGAGAAVGAIIGYCMSNSGGNERDTGLIDLSDEQIADGARDKSKSPNKPVDLFSSGASASRIRLA